MSILRTIADHILEECILFDYLTPWINFTDVASRLIDNNRYIIAALCILWCKFLIEKIVATIFNIEEFAEQFNLQKVSYRTFIGLILLPINIYLFYNNTPANILIYITIAVILIINLFSYLVSLKIYQNLLIGKLFYFILYLCALEIAPYYFMYYLITKNLAH